MTDGKVKIDRLTTGIPGLDGIFSGGFPVGSLNIIAGGPGVGKSTMALQILFNQAVCEAACVYFITVSEPSVKFLRYMQQYDFFDLNLFPEKVGFLDVSTVTKDRKPVAAFEAMQKEISNRRGAVIAIDSFKALREQFEDSVTARAALYDFFTNLGVWGVTAFLVGEYDDYEIGHLPEFFAADGIVKLSVAPEGLRAVRRLEVVKLRGSSYVPGKHFFDITPGGIVVYPRIGIPSELEIEAVPGGVARLATGVDGLDEMLGGGIPARTTTLIEGGTGTGKTLLSISFLVNGALKGEPGLLFAMEETREQLFEIGAGRGWPLEDLDRQGLLQIIYTSPVEFVSDVMLQRVKDQIDKMGARRAVIDSLKTLEMSMSSQGRLRELMYALVKTFRAKGVTTLLTNEIPELVGTTELSGRGFSSIADNIIFLRYVELEARLVQSLAVLKVRGSSHERVLRELRITAESMSVVDAFSQLQGVITGLPTPAESSGRTRRRSRPPAS